MNTDGRIGPHKVR